MPTVILRPDSTTSQTGWASSNIHTIINDNNTGTVTTVAPTGSGQFVRIVGYCMENSNSRIYFNPDNTYIEIA